jgi:hypothetical protein
MWRLASVKWTTGGIRPRATQRTVLMKAATPAAASWCPRLALTAPSTSFWSGRRPSASTERSASTSIGSPIGVPVPWASTKPISRPETPAAASARRIMSAWARPFGAVMVLVRPSWATAEPRMTAHTRSPSRRASDSRLRTTAPAPSPRTMPSAWRSNVRQRPVGESAPSLV